MKPFFALLPTSQLALALGLWVFAVAGQELPAQEPPPSVALSAVRITPESAEVFRLDGFLTEAFWAEAQPITQFRQNEPAEGEPATEDTEVLVVYDDENLFVGVRALDSEPERVVSRILERDKIMQKDPFFGRPVFGGDDAIAILLDPFDDNRNAYVFATNPNGAEFDALLADEGKEFNADWRGVWEVAGTKTAEGWSAEFRIPLRTLRYPNDSERPWGFNVYRIIRRKNEKALWRAWSRDNGGFHRVSQAGDLEGIGGLPPTGRNLETKPYVLGGLEETRRDDGTLSRSSETSVGLDMKTEVRPGLVLDLTLNTDFAQVEVDDERVNLTRFSLFFPEKRDFFLENSGVFDFGVQGNPFEPPQFQMFFSRRIGIEEDEDEVVPIMGGGRLTGRLGGQTVGLLTVVTNEVKDIVPREVFSVARVKRDIGDNNYFGVMATDRRSSDGQNTVVGADGSFYLTPATNVQAWFAHTFTQGGGGDDLAYGVSGTWRSDLWEIFGRIIQVGPETEAKAGFIQRHDVRRSEIFARRSFRPGFLNIRRVDLWFGGNIFTSVDGTLEDWAGGPVLATQFESGAELNVFFQPGENRPDEDFDLADSLYVPVGEYDATVTMVMFSTNPSRPVVLRGNANASNFYGGTLRAVGGNVTVAPIPQVALSAGMDRSRVKLPSGEFTSNLINLRGTYSFSTRLSANLLVQYNSLDEVFSSNLRVNFIHRPGSDLFLVFTEERGVDDDLWKISDRASVVKLTYLKRF
ncbi:MAG: carbohydrate binding family 9 domain-containing protein [Gemmatimonadetes bacterium]|nr:carbohydrate binding family 9 domain-containing protein [Gemmatimonadota bacterium]